MFHAVPGDPYEMMLDILVETGGDIVDLTAAMGSLELMEEETMALLVLWDRIGLEYSLHDNDSCYLNGKLDIHLEHTFKILWASFWLLCL